MTPAQITAELFRLQDKTYRDFQAKLIPTIHPETIIGVRTPTLLSLAKQLVKEIETADFLAALPHQYFDENQLHAFIISETKDFAHWISSAHTYTVRFGIGMLMQHFLDDAFEPAFLEKNNYRSFGRILHQHDDCAEVFRPDFPLNSVKNFYRTASLRVGHFPRYLIPVAPDFQLPPSGSVLPVGILLGIVCIVFQDFAQVAFCVLHKLALYFVVDCLPVATENTCKLRPACDSRETPAAKKVAL